MRSIDTSKLSDLFLWLVSERPEQVVGILQAHWSSYKDQLKPEIIKALRKVRALGRKVAIPLSRTWAPTEELVKTSQNVGLVEKMPFLKLPTELDVKTQEKGEIPCPTRRGFRCGHIFLSSDAMCSLQ